MRVEAKSGGCVLPGLPGRIDGPIPWLSLGMGVMLDDGLRIGHGRPGWS